MVREAGQHDVQPENTSFVPLEEERWTDAATQVLYEKGNNTNQLMSCITSREF